MVCPFVFCVSDCIALGFMFVSRFVVLLFDFSCGCVVSWFAYLVLGWFCVYCFDYYFSIVCFDRLGCFCVLWWVIVICICILVLVSDLFVLIFTLLFVYYLLGLLFYSMVWDCRFVCSGCCYLIYLICVLFCCLLCLFWLCVGVICCLYGFWCGWRFGYVACCDTW